MSESELHCRPMAGDEPMLSLLELSERFDEVAGPECERFRIRRGGNGLRRMACCSDVCSKTRRHDAYFSQLDRAPTIREDPPCRNHHGATETADISVPPKGSLCGRLVGVSITERGFSRTVVPSRRVSREGTYADHARRFSRSHYARSRMLFRRSRPLRYGQRSGAIERRFR